MSSNRLNLVLAFVLLLAAASACGDGTAPAPKATNLVLVTAPPAIAETMVPLTIQPVIQAADANGNGTPTATTISVEVLNGNGTVTAGGSAVTSPAGVATFSGLTLGAVTGLVGSLTLRFTAPGLAPVLASIELRCALAPLVIGQTINRDLTTGDCTSTGGKYSNYFELATTQLVTAVRLTHDAPFRKAVFVRGTNEPRVAWGLVESGFAAVAPLDLKILLPPGRHAVTASSAETGQTGRYSLRAAVVSEDLTCEPTPAFAASPITTAQQLVTGDCLQNSFLQDILVVGMQPLASITASMSSAAFQPQIKLVNALTNAVAASATNPGSASISFANGDAGIPYYLLLTSSIAGASGNYSLSVNIAYPASNISGHMAPAEFRGPILNGANSARLTGRFLEAWSRVPR